MEEKIWVPEYFGMSPTVEMVAKGVYNHQKPENLLGKQTADENGKKSQNLKSEVGGKPKNNRRSLT